MKSMKEVARLARRRARKTEEEIQGALEREGENNSKPPTEDARFEVARAHQHGDLLKFVPIIEKALREINWLGINLLWAKRSQFGYIFDDRTFPDGFYPLDQFKNGTHPDFPINFYLTYGYSQ